MVIALVANGDKAEPAHALAARTGLSDRSADAVLSDLTDTGLVRKIGDGFAIPAESSEMRSAQMFAQAYDANPMAVIRALYKRTVSSAVSFAEAFRIRRNDS